MLALGLSECDKGLAGACYRTQAKPGRPTGWLGSGTRAEALGNWGVHFRAAIIPLLPPLCNQKHRCAVKRTLPSAIQLVRMEQS